MSYSTLGYTANWIKSKSLGWLVTHKTQIVSPEFWFWLWADGVKNNRIYIIYIKT